MKPFNGVAGSLRAIQASLLTVHCAGWALWHQAGTQEETVHSAVHNKWIPGLQRITGPWTVDGQTQALELLREGGALVIANHQSMLDIPLLMSACGPVPRFTAKAAIRSWPILGAFLSATGTCFIDRRLHALRNAPCANGERQCEKSPVGSSPGFQKVPAPELVNYSRSSPGCSVWPQNAGCPSSWSF